MTIRVMFAAACALALTAGAGVVRAGEETPKETTDQATAGKPQTLCPVMKEPILKKNFFDYQGKRIYVCCRSCIKVIQKDPEKYIKQMEAEGIVLEKVPAPTGEGADTNAPAATQAP